VDVFFLTQCSKSYVGHHLSATLRQYCLSVCLSVTRR